MNQVANEIHFVSAKKETDILLNELKYSCTIGEPLGGLYVPLCNYSCLTGTLTTQRLQLIYTVENVGGGIGQDPATEVTHSWDKSTSSFFQCTTSYQVWYELEV